MKRALGLVSFVCAANCFSAPEYLCKPTVTPPGQQPTVYEEFEVPPGKAVFLGKAKEKKFVLKCSLADQLLTIEVLEIGVPKDRGGNEAGNRPLGKAIADWDAKRLELELTSEGVKVACRSK